MIIRSVEDKDFLTLTDDVIKALKNAKDHLVIDDNGIKGHIIIKDTAGLNEVINWRVDEEHLLAFKAIKRKNGTLYTNIPETKTEELKTLLKAGFKEITRQEGLHPNEKTIMLKY